MDPRLNHPGPSSYSHYSRLIPSRHVELDDSASLSQAEYILGNIQNGGWEEVQNIGGSTWYPSHLRVLYGELYRLECVWP